MTKENKLRKLKRKDLLEILLLQNKKIKELEKELISAKYELNDKKIIISEAGSIDEASLKLNKVFEVAQKAAEDYLKNINDKDNSNNKNKKQEYNKKTTLKKENKNDKEC